MGDIKLFRTGSHGATELEGKSVVVEKTLQALMEKHLDEFLGVSFLASEYQTGKTHRGRIDSLGIEGWLDIGVRPIRGVPRRPMKNVAVTSKMG